MSEELLPAKDRSVSAATFYGNAKEAEYRIEGNPGLILVVFPPDSDERSHRVWSSQSLVASRTVLCCG